MSEHIEGLHAHRRFEKEGDRCPIDEENVSISKCGSCDYFRGASSLDRGPAILCNFPQNGSQRYQRSIPAAFDRAFEDVA